MTRIGVNTVVSLVGVETTFANTASDLRVRVNAQSGHAGKVGPHVGFTHNGRLHAKWTQVITYGHFADFERNKIPAGTV